MVTDFLKWCELNKKHLPELDVEESTKRGGIRGQYPDGYVRSQYPDAYFAPTSATAYLDLKNAKGVKHVKDAGNTPL